MSEVTPTPEDQPKKTKRINSKKKGSGFEGHIGKLLGEKLAPMKFRRSQSSGAILGGQNERFMDQFSADAKALFIGDVVPTNEADVIREQGWRMKFTIECKFYRDIDSLEHLLDKTRITGWYDKARIDAQKISKQPLLIFKFNHSRTFCALEAGYALPLTLRSMLSLHRYNPPNNLELRIFFLDEAFLDLNCGWREWKTSK